MERLKKSLFFRRSMFKMFRKNEFEVLIHEEPKQAYVGDGRRTVVENASYGEPE